LPQAVMIDKDGAKALALPGTMPSDKTTTAAAAMPASLGSSDMPLMMPAVAPQPELMVSEPNAAQPIPLSPLNATPVAASEDGAPVDRRLLQRGFSHAFDELLTPSDAAAAGGEKP
ncbi:MAG: hypothetical protein AB7H77_03920, partial [Bdellovibrionales bacterium]